MARKPAKKPRGRGENSRPRGSVKKAQAESLARSQASKKGWETRRQKAAKKSAQSTAETKKKPTKPKKGSAGAIVTPQELNWSELYAEVAEIRKKRKLPTRQRGRSYVTLTNEDGQLGYNRSVSMNLALIEENVEELIYKTMAGAGDIEAVNSQRPMIVSIFLFENGSNIGSPGFKKKEDPLAGMSTKSSWQGIPLTLFIHLEPKVRGKFEWMVDALRKTAGACIVDSVIIRSFVPAGAKREKGSG